MDILIRNIEIPKDCTDCFCYKDAGYCGITKTEVDFMEEYGTLNNDCPLNAHIEPQNRTIEPEPHWIPCSEKYPDQDERVIVTIGGYNIWVWDCMANRGDDYFWEDEQGFYHNKYEIDAWMPLPEVYREGE